jgi:TPR repeat protein
MNARSLGTLVFVVLLGGCARGALVRPAAPVPTRPAAATSPTVVPTGISTANAGADAGAKAGAKAGASGPEAASPVHRDAPPGAPASFSVAERTADAYRVMESRAFCEQQPVSVCRAACDSGNLDVCVVLGTMYVQGRRVKRDIRRADQYLGKACREHATDGCSTEGWALMSTDRVRAARILGDACQDDRGWPEHSCEALISMIDVRLFTPKTAQALALFRRACALAPFSGGQLDSACGRLKDLGEDAPLP